MPPHRDRPGRPPGPTRRAATIGRRRLLGGLATGGVAALAGCAGNGNGDDRRPEFAGDGWWTTLYGTLEEVDLASPSGELEPFVFDVGFVRDPATGEAEYVHAEGYEETGAEASITLRDGLEWSNGDPLTAAGLGRWLLMVRAGTPWLRSVPEIRDGESPPRSPWEAITDVEWDERTVTVTGDFELVESPASVLNEYVGSRPARYTEERWDAFRRAYEDRPWESEASRRRVDEALDDGVWLVTSDDLPVDLHLEAETANEDGGWEAAYSGLWYPVERDAGNLRFRVNEAHPFADRANFDEVVWTFTDDPQGPLTDARAGAVDGAMRTDLTEEALEAVPDGTTSVPGPARGVTVLTLNQRADALRKRDVRAAVQYAIDRERLAETANSATHEAVSVPGADLQPERLLSADVRETLRPYEYDPDRAAALLERAGFTRDGDEWRTPDGEAFELEVVTRIGDSTLDRAVASDLRDVGIDASYVTVENTTYQERVRNGYFAGTCRDRAAPSAAGADRTRTADVVRRPPFRRGAPTSAYLGAALEELDEREAAVEWGGGDGEDEDDGAAGVDADALGIGDAEAVRSLTVEAPPLGDPDGELREWPYLYHAAMIDAEPSIEDKRAHAERCTWIYNYQVPEAELVIERPLIVHRTGGWDLPAADDPVWRRTGPGAHPSGLWAALAYGRIRAE